MLLARPLCARACGAALPAPRWRAIGTTSVASTTSTGSSGSSPDTRASGIAAAAKPPPPHLLQRTRHAVPLDELELEESFIKGGGKGGQKVNKAASCVMLKHLPTGTTVRTQRFRDLQSNRREARKLLALELDDLFNGEESKRSKEHREVADKKKRNADKARARRGKKEAEKTAGQANETSESDDASGSGDRSSASSEHYRRKMASDTRRNVDYALAFVAGGCGGIANVLIGHPFDTLKVRLQTSNEYNGLIDCARKTVARDGVRGLYKGIASPLLGVSPMWALSFWSYEMGQRMVVYFRHHSSKGTQLSLWEIALAGCWSSVPTTIITTPMERVKVILQTQGQSNSTTHYKGLIDAGASVFRQSGIAGLYRGTAATLLRDVPGGAVYFATYEFFYRRLKTEGNGLSVGAALFAGGMSGVGMWSVSIPADVIKSRIQSAEAGKYRGILHCAQTIVAEGGVGALYSGFGPAMLRSFPANGMRDPSALSVSTATNSRLTHSGWMDGKNVRPGRNAETAPTPINLEYRRTCGALARNC
ncbi:carnitine transporter [Entophlyctis sp. JEL0112]|nr:carnitine transporter [Entophlyctis sp. JEL0112]